MKVGRQLADRREELLQPRYVAGLASARSNSSMIAGVVGCAIFCAVRLTGPSTSSMFGGIGRSVRRAELIAERTWSLRPPLPHRQEVARVPAADSSSRDHSAAASELAPTGCKRSARWRSQTTPPAAESARTLSSSSGAIELGRRDGGAGQIGPARRTPLPALARRWGSDDAPVVERGAGIHFSIAAACQRGTATVAIAVIPSGHKKARKSTKSDRCHRVCMYASPRVISQLFRAFSCSFVAITALQSLSM